MGILILLHAVQIPLAKMVRGNNDDDNHIGNESKQLHNSDNIFLLTIGR